DIGGNHQQLTSVETQHVGVTFKHVLLPVWMTSYRYRDRTYRVVINGRTGEVMGDRPYSVWKIFFLVVILLALLAGLVFLIVRVSGGRATAPRSPFAPPAVAAARVAAYNHSGPPTPL